MSTFKITNQEQFEECLMWVSDLYKDVNGFRPRGYNFQNWSFQELTDFVNDLSATSEKMAQEEIEFKNKAISDVMSVGASDELEARRWLDQADAYFMWGDDEFAVEEASKYGWVADMYS
jgi:hypothetical protein